MDSKNEMQLNEKLCGHQPVKDDPAIYNESITPIGPVSNVTADFIRELKEIFSAEEIRNILMNNFQFNIG